MIKFSFVPVVYIFRTSAALLGWGGTFKTCWKLTVPLITATLMQMKKKSRRSRSQPCSLTVWLDLDAEHLVVAASSFSQAHKSQFLNLEVLSPYIRGELGEDSRRLDDKLLSPTCFLVQPIYTISLAPCLLTSEMRVMFSRERARAMGSVLAEVQGQLSLGQAQCSPTASPYSSVRHLASELSTLLIAVFSEDIVPSPFDV